MLKEINEIINKGGPGPDDYSMLNNIFNAIYTLPEERKQDLTHKVRKLFKNLSSMQSLQGHAYQKPYGYAGDFKIISKIIDHYISEDPDLKNWDFYFHSQDAPKAVRNRKKYLSKILALCLNKEEVNILYFGCGAAKDLYNILSLHNYDFNFTCIDSDKNAIQYAKLLFHELDLNISFYQANLFTFKPAIKYHLVWCPGLFDYFSKRIFIRFLFKMKKWLTDDGEIVIGNFSNLLPTKGYMDIIGDWKLIYRDSEELIALALEAGYVKEKIHISTEETGYNLFLHLRI